jgi:hypothetical protein
VSPEILTAQFGLETGWGKHVIPGTNNLGNIKDFSGSGVAATDSMTGSRDQYRQYQSPEHFADDFAALIEKRYPQAIGSGNDPLRFARALKAGGYAEDPAYIQKVVAAHKMVPAQSQGAPWEAFAGGDAQQPVVPVSAGGRAAPSSQFADVKAGVEKTPPKSLLDKNIEFAKNVPGGLVRGAGSIGATLYAPIDALEQFIGRKMGADMPAVDRRGGMDSGLASMGFDPASAGFKTGKIGGEIAGTAGVGGMLAGAASRVPVIAANAPNLINAIRTGGMVAGPTAGAANMATRIAGGAVTGGASAGLVDPSQAVTGSVIGAVLPPVAKVAGAAGNAIGNMIRGPAQTADMANAIQAARTSGYVIPPTQANPTGLNRVIEGFSGKLTTAQNASAKNQAVTNAKIARDIGLPADTKLTPDVFDAVRKQAGQAYDNIASTGTVNAGKPYENALDAIVAPLKKAASGFPNAKPNPLIEEVESLKSARFDASAAVEKVKELRDYATAAYGKQDKATGRVYKQAANAIEDALENHLKAIGAPADTINAFRDARKLIAKTYSAQSATNATTGSVDARKLATQLNRGKMLSGETKDAAEFAARFPKATQPVEGMGSLPGFSPLDWSVSGIASAASANPLMMAGVLARPAARALALSPAIQNRLVQGNNNAFRQLLANPDAQQALYRAAPVIGANR